MAANALIAFLQHYRHIPLPDQELINGAFEQHVYPEGSVLLKPGHISNNLFFIVKGVLRIMVTNEKGVEITHYFLKEDQFCTILNSFHNQVIAMESIQAACDAEVLAIGRTALLKLYEQLPYLRTLIDQITQQALIDKIAIRNLYLGHPSAQRYRLFVERQTDIAQRVSMADTASYLGITPQSLSRIRKNLR
ncbi:Crp/Fnr family transcriptional regulator [Mucilaginibacter daejeonensis]|uniref:Crp/Fnr family transcriptional regulator n=1 Tax=Mucilaginibacter daejeonensis TaxID=398049 RepID=UPI001D170CD9|nr:Crp/Fnr family transcriptional regulator [Mucilaginibacter daejeonensis]UEG54610.1 Crp/Fnr family transcriptional regulator [Mucilaginibacter daejeonensis]